MAKLALFSFIFHVSTYFFPHPKPPISQQVPLACRWLLLIRGFIVTLASYFRNHALFFPVFTYFHPLGYFPTGPASLLDCWWLSGVFPQLLLLLLHGNHHFCFVFLFFSCKSRCVRIVNIYLTKSELLISILLKFEYPVLNGIFTL